MGMLGSQCEFVCPFKLTQFWSKLRGQLNYASFWAYRIWIGCGEQATSQSEATPQMKGSLLHADEGWPAPRVVCSEG